MRVPARNESPALTDIRADLRLLDRLRLLIRLRYPHLLEPATPLTLVVALQVVLSLPFYHQSALTAVMALGSGCCLWILLGPAAQPGTPAWQPAGALLVLCFLCLGLPEALIIAGRSEPIIATDRAAIGLPDRGLTDSVAQQEEAGRLLLRGTDPNGHDYSALLPDDSGSLPRPNPAAHHYIYLPGTALLSALGVLIAGAHADFRLWYLVALGGLVGGMFLSGRSQADGLAMVGLTVLSPVYLLSWLWGTNDILMLAPLALSLATFQRERQLASSLLFGLALGMKQTAFVFLPLYAVLVLARWGRGRGLRWLALTLLVPAVVIVPFAVWGLPAFVRDTVTFFGGSGGRDGFPIMGWSLPALFLRLGWLHDPWQPHPAWLLKLGLVLPVLGLGVWRLSQRPDRRRAFLWSGLALLAVTASSRAGFDHYYIVPLGLLTLAGWSWLTEPSPSRLIWEERARSLPVARTRLTAAS
jgi:hypothetical protein